MKPNEINADIAARLRDWADDYVAGKLAPADREALERQLLASEAARRFFVSYLELHAGLAWQFRGADCALPMPRLEGQVGDLSVDSRWDSEAMDPLNEDQLNTANGCASDRLPTGSAWRWRWPSAVAALAILVFAVVSWSWLREPSLEPGENDEPVFAVVRGTLRGRWADGREVRVSEHVGRDSLKLQSGLISLTGADGVELLVEGPAIAEWLSAQRLRLTSGSIVVRMPQGQSGFVVETARMRVTDLGTEFGVSVGPNGDERVQVYDGRVRTETVASGKAQELNAGGALQCSADGEFAPAAFVEERFTRRMPRTAPATPGGPLYNRSNLESVEVVRAASEVSVDGQLAEWNRGAFFRSACEPPYAATYFVQGGMMYDAAHLYVAARVGDPEPMRNAARDGFQFAGGSVIVRLAADRRLGWPLKGTGRPFRPPNASPELLADSVNERVTSLILWFDATSGQAKLDLQHSFELQRPATVPAGWQGAFQKNADGLGYTLEYAIPWRLFHCENDPPRGGDVLGTLWTVHWSDAEGRVCFGQLTDVTNQYPPVAAPDSPAAFFLSGPHWGRAVFQPEAPPK